jgi:hypothetical protein
MTIVVPHELWTARIFNGWVVMQLDASRPATQGADEKAANTTKIQ